jgi:hypothetical protein
MVTKEALLARRAQLEEDIAAQEKQAAQADADRQGAIAKVARCHDLINALSGAKQDVDHWLAQFPVPEPTAPDAQKPDPTAEPVKDPVN